MGGQGAGAAFQEHCSVVNTEQAGDRGIGLTEDEKPLLFGFFLSKVGHRSLYKKRLGNVFYGLHHIPEACYTT